MKSRESFMPRRLTCLCLLGATVSVILMFLMAEVRMLRVPVQWDYGEGHVLWMSQHITNAETAYRPIDRLPYVVFPYTPLFLFASRVVGVLFEDPLVAGRSLSLACTIGIAVVVALSVFWCVPARFPRIWRLSGAAFGAALMLCMQSVAGWGALMRVDMLALFFMFAGLAIYIVLGKKEQWQFVSAFLFILAIFTKQTMLSAPLACAIFGLTTNPRAAIRVYGFAIILGLSAIFFCNAVTHGGFWRNVVDYNLNPFSWKIALREVYTHLQENVASVAVAVAALFSIWNARAIRRFGWKGFLQVKSDRMYDRAVLICGLNWLLAGMWTLAIGKMGSAYNFFLTFDISTSFLCGFSLFRLLATWSANNRNRNFAPLVLTLLFSLMLLPARSVVAGLMDRFDARVDKETQLVRLIRATPGPVMSENLLALIRASKEVHIEPATVSFLAQIGRWDERPYLQLLDQQYFQMIVAVNLRGTNRYTQAMTSSIDRAYSLDQTIGEYLIYRPRSSP